MAGKKTANNNNSEQISLYDYQLKEVSVRLVLKETSALYSSTPITSPQDAVNVMGDLMRGLDRETVFIINMDNKMRAINYTAVSQGGINFSMVPVANCFKAALLSANAACVALLHNHPSGDATPSQEDFDVTKRMVQAGKLLDIPVIDHIIIGAYHGEQFSFRENYPDMFYAEPDLSVFPEIDTSKGWHAAEEKPVYEAGKNNRISNDQDRKDPAKKSVIERLSEKKEQAVGADRVAPVHTKNEYSL